MKVLKAGNCVYKFHMDLKGVIYEATAISVVFTSLETYLSSCFLANLDISNDVLPGNAN